MFEVDGRRIPVTVTELLQEPAALVIWDMQEGIARRAADFTSVVAAIGRLLTAARRRRIPVIYSQMSSRPFSVEDRVWIRSRWLLHGRPDPATLKPDYPVGTDRWQIVSELAPSDDDVVIQKTRASFFVGTTVRAMLAARAIDVMVLTGVTTNIGILGTARDAVQNGVFPVIVSDAVTAFSVDAHELALKQLNDFADLCTTDEVLAIWGGP